MKIAGRKYKQIYDVFQRTSILCNFEIPFWCLGRTSYWGHKFSNWDTEHISEITRHHMNTLFFKPTFSKILPPIHQFSFGNQFITFGQYFQKLRANNNTSSSQIYMMFSWWCFETSLTLAALPRRSVNAACSFMVALPCCTFFLVHRRAVSLPSSELNLTLCDLPLWAKWHGDQFIGKTLLAA